MDLCQICRLEEATEQLSNESKLYVCYSCKIFQKEVVIKFPKSPPQLWDEITEKFYTKMEKVTKILNETTPDYIPEHTGFV